MKLALIADIHGNLDALRAIFDDLPAVDEVLCLGDIVGYGPEPAECVDFLRDHGVRSVLGNHDRAVATGDASFFSFGPWARDAIAWTLRVVDRNLTDFLAKLPERIRIDELDALAVHGSPRDPLREYVNHPKTAAGCFRASDARLTLIGHTHRAGAFVKRFGRTLAVRCPTDCALPLRGRTILNPGAVGQPRDHNPKASYGILTDTAFQIRRVGYDIESVARKIRKAGLPEYLAWRLGCGL